MTFLPIVDRELRVAARRKATYRMRAWAASGVVAVCAYIFLVGSRGNVTPHDLGNTLFSVVSGVLLFYCLAVGAALTADCLSEEKREGTLGLLFLTDLTGLDVVVGKLATTSINALYALLAALPVLALPLLLGGVSPGEFPRMALVFLNTLFLSLAIGLFVSAISYHARKAATATSCLILLFAVGAPALGAWLEYLLRTPGIGEPLALPSPVYTFMYAFDRPYRTGADKFWTSAIMIHLLAWLSLVLASQAAKRTWHDKPKTTGGWSGWCRMWSLGSPTERRALRLRLLHVNPFLWRVGRERWKRWAVWVGLGLAGLVWLGGAIKYDNDWFGQPCYIATAFLLTVALKLGVATEAGYVLGEDRRSGALELLLSTPVTVRGIVRGQLLALKRQFLGPGCVVLALCFLFFLSALGDGTLADDRAPLLAVWLAGMVMLLADCVALAVVGMWMGLTQNGPSRAAGATVSRVLLLPWAIFALGIAWVALDLRRNPGWGFFLGLWFVPGLLADLLFGVWAWRKLNTEFRQVVMERGTPASGWWRRAGRAFGGMRAGNSRRAA